jgi:EpsI family protein
VLDKLAPSSYTARIYKKKGRQLGLFIAYYDQQRAGETMHSPKVCLPGGGWEIAQQGFTTISVGGRPVKLNQYHIQNAGQRMLVLYWYQSRGRIIASEYLGKLLLIRDAVLMGRTSGSIVRITLPDDLMSAEEAADFAKELIPQVQHCLSD